MPRGLHAIKLMTIALAAGLAGMIALVAVAPDPGAPPDDVLVVGLNAEPRSLDPHVTTALNDFRVLVNLYEGLVRFRDGSLEIEPALAERWTVSDGGRVYTFHLRAGVRFHDGAPFDAAAVKFNLERMLDPEHPYHHTGPFPLAFFFERVQRVEVVGPRVVRLHLDRPFAPLLSNLAYPTGLMISPAAVKRWGRDVGRHPAGTGPFAFAGWEGERRVVLKRHPDYRGEPAAIETVVFRTIGDDMTRVAELRAGGLEIVAELSPDNVAWFRENDRFVVHERAGPHLWFLILNAAEPPFDDRRMRLAANLAIDREGLVENVLLGTAEPAAGPIPAAFGAANDPGVRPWPHDPERARALVAEAGYADGVDVVFYVPHGGSGMLAPVQMATAIQADLAAVGIRARIETYEWNTYLDKVNGGLKGKAHLAEMAWMTNDPDTLPYLALRSAARPPDGFNSGHFADPEIDRLVEAARVETDPAARAALYRALERRVHEQVPWVVVASWKQNAVTSRRLRGFELQPSFLLKLDRASKRPAEGG